MGGFFAVILDGLFETISGGFFSKNTQLVIRPDFANRASVKIVRNF